LQYSYLSSQFSDSSNSIESNLSGVIGEIPAYSILDISLNYKLGRFKFESGVNNLLNNYYFTRRATGYPGPGIIPSPPRNYYFTLQYKF
jgi:Fe(3+) dicitrate transport protein